MNGLRRKEARRRGLLVLARGQKRRQIVFLVWVDLSEHKWVILAERRGFSSVVRSDPCRAEIVILNAKARTRECGPLLTVALPPRSCRRGECAKHAHSP